MNYFELLKLPVSFKPDKTELHKAYFQLQRSSHPDMFTNSSELEQSEALERSAMINKAFKTLSDEDATIYYVLEQKGLISEGEKYELDPLFLMEVMELNETLLTEEGSPDANEKSVKEQLEQLYAPVKSIIENYSDETTSQEDMLLVKDYYYKKKYMKRLLDRIGGMRNIAPPE